MNRTFFIPEPFRVPDGTLVSPFLNANDSQSDLPFDLLSGFSLFAGIIEPMSSSKLHVMFFVTQVTFVRSGRLSTKMKGPQDADAYQLHLAEGQSVLTEPGALLQLINDTNDPCEALCIATPPYVFEMDGEGKVLYDDSVVLDNTGYELAQSNWRPSVSMPTLAQRETSAYHIAQGKV